MATADAWGNASMTSETITPPSVATPSMGGSPAPPMKLGEHQAYSCVAERYKTKVCRNFMTQGVCQYEQKCMFAHGDRELRTKEMNMAEGITSEAAVKKYRKHQRRANQFDSEAPQQLQPHQLELQAPTSPLQQLHGFQAGYQQEPFALPPQQRHLGLQQGQQQQRQIQLQPLPQHTLGFSPPWTQADPFSRTPPMFPQQAQAPSGRDEAYVRSAGDMQWQQQQLQQQQQQQPTKASHVGAEAARPSPGGHLFTGPQFDVWRVEGLGSLATAGTTLAFAVSGKRTQEWGALTR